MVPRLSIPSPSYEVRATARSSLAMDWIYRIRQEKMSMERLRRTLVARGQWGLIIPPVPESDSNLSLDLSGLTGVTIGTSLHQPLIHRVSPNHFQGCALACQQQLPQRERVPPLLIAANDQGGIERWLRRETPAVILLAEKFPWPDIHLLNGGQAQHVSLAWLMPQPGQMGLGSLDYRRDQLGRAAVDIVVAQIHRNERGSPTMPQTVLINAEWTEPVNGMPP